MWVSALVRCKIYLAIAAAALQFLLLGPAYAQSCNENLAKVDQRLAENVGLDAQFLRTLRTWRDQAAELCLNGQDASANAALEPVNMLLDGHARRNSNQKTTNRAKESAAKKQSVKQLTGPYLAGDWCAAPVTDNARYDFTFQKDGTWQTFRRGTIEGQGVLWHFLDRYKSLADKQPNAFTAIGRSNERIEFQRGRC